MPNEQSPVKPTTRRYSPEEKALRCGPTSTGATRPV
jgi:hypothetical protein